MNRWTIAAGLALASLAAGCQSAPDAASSEVISRITFGCPTFDLRVTRYDGRIEVVASGQTIALQQSRQSALRYERDGTLAQFAPNRTVLEWTSGATTVTCIAGA